MLEFVPPDAAAPFVYESKLADWYTRASVRVKPQRILTVGPDEADRFYFSPDLVPTASHPLVTAMADDAMARILIQRMYMYLEFVARLEHDVVNRVTMRIALQRSGLNIPQAMALDAHKILTDEAYHAQFAAELKYNIVRETGVAPNAVCTPHSLQQLKVMLLPLGADYRKLAELFFGIVSETLISAGVLCHVPRDGRVVTSVRLHIADHAEDEGRHHAYFARLLECIWPQLDAGQRAVIGPLLPRFVRAWLEPDFDTIARELLGCGLSASEIQDVVHDSYPPDAVVRQVRESSRATMRLFERVGILDDTRLRDTFHQSGLLG